MRTTFVQSGDVIGERAHIGRSRQSLGLVVVISASLLGILSQPATAAGARFKYSITPSTTQPYAACPPPTRDTAQCMAIIFPRPRPASVPPRSNSVPVEGALAGSGAGHGFSAQDLQSAYRLPSSIAGSGQTVAIVATYDDPNAQADLNVYRATYNLPPCEGGCFSKVNQEGGTTYPAPSSGWALEMSLDLDMVSAACPKCHILLVEANSNTLANLGTAENEAATLGATEISNSYGAREIEMGKAQVEADAKYYQHSGIPITVASGDDGYEDAQFNEYQGEECLHCSPQFPAGLSSVIAVGGTALGPVGESGRGWAEDVWFYSGSGCTLYVTKPTWQTDKGCKDRSDNDIAAVAEGASVYDTYAIGPPGWQNVAGTSISSPLTAAAIALETSTERLEGVEGIYKHPSNWYDVTQGSNYAGIGPVCKEGTELVYMCHGEIGYDGPTGIGAPDGGATVTPPSAMTEAASAVTTTGAMLNGDVDPEASETTYYFEYGRTTLYGTNIPFTPEKVPGYTAPHSVKQPISGLKPQTEYHFRVVSKSAGGTTHGPDQVFWTAPKLAHSQFGSKGTAEGKFEKPEFAATNVLSDVWVSDYSNDRIEEFSPNGTFMKSCGKAGSGEGQFSGPTGIAVSGGQVYVSDSGNNRIEVLGEGCEYWDSFGSGYVSDPMGLTFTSAGGAFYGGFSFGKDLLLVANAGGNSIELFSAQTELIEGKKVQKHEGTYGVKGTGDGEFSNPTDVVLAGEESAYSNLFYVVDSGNDRVQEFSVSGLKSEEMLRYKFIEKFGAAGSGEAQLASPTGVAVDPTTGDVDVTDTGNNRVETFLPNGTYITKFGSSGAGPEKLERPGGLTVDSGGDLYIADEGNDRVDVWSHPEWHDEPTPKGPTEPAEEPKSALYRASCVTWSLCEAVGEYSPESYKGSAAPLAEMRKNGNEWSVQTVPLPSGTIGELNDVSCVSSGMCVAVGGYGATQADFGSEWSGREWTSQIAVAPTGAKASYLEGVSCRSITACTAVGTYQSSAGVLTALARELERQQMVPSDDGETA